MERLNAVQLSTGSSDSQRVAELVSRLRGPINKLARRYPVQRSAIMPALWHAQQEYGHISAEVMEAVAEILQLSPVQVYEIATFYSMFHTTPIGRYHLQLCTNVSCMLAGAEDLLAHIEQNLGIGEGESTADGLFTLSCAECLGSCDTAPVMQINNEPYIENLSVQRIDEMLQTLRGRQERTD